MMNTMKSGKITVVILALLLTTSTLHAELVSLLGETTKESSARTVGDSYELSNDSTITEVNDPNDIRMTSYEDDRKPLYQARIVPTFKDGSLEKLFVYVAFEGALYGGYYTHLENVPQDFDDNRRFRVRKDVLLNDLTIRPTIADTLTAEWKNMTEEFLPLTLKSAKEECEVTTDNFIDWSTETLMSYVTKDESLQNTDTPCVSQYKVSYTLVRKGDHFIFIDEDHDDSDLEINNNEFVQNDWNFEDHNQYEENNYYQNNNYYQQNNYYEQSDKKWSINLNFDFNSSNNSNSNSSIYFNSQTEQFNLSFRGSFQAAMLFPPLFPPLLPLPAPIFFAPPALFL